MLVYWYISTFLYSYILIFLHSELLITCHLCDSAYPLSYGFIGFISPVSCTLILNQYKSSFSTYIILFIKSVISAPFSLSLSLKNSVFKYLESKNRYSITDFINRIVQVLKKDLYWVKISTQNAELMEPVKP